MPVYEYACKKCGHEFEREQRITDKPVKKCPSCGALQAKRLISRTSFVLKGGGWYGDLYASPSGKKDADDAGAKPGADDAGSSEKKSEKSDKADAGASDGGSKGSGGKGKTKGKGKKPAAA